MKKNVKSGKHKAMALIAVLMILAMVLSIVVPIFASTYVTNAISSGKYYEMDKGGLTSDANGETEKTSILDEDAPVKSESINIETEAGFNGVYMLNRQTPVKVTVYNNGEEFKGTVKVKVFSKIPTEYAAATYVEYLEDIDILPGGVGVTNFVVYPKDISTYINVKVLDENGNIIVSQNINVTPTNQDQIITAVLTDNKSSNVDYLKQLNIGEDIYKRRNYQTNYIAFLNKDTFPESVDVLSSISAIIIEDFNTSSLSEEQISALLKWVEKGGLLAVGTGLNAEKTLKGLDSIFDYKFNGYDTALCFGGKANIANIDIPGAEATEIQDGKTITRTLKVSDGKVVVHSFALSVDPVASMADRSNYFSMFYRNTMPNKFSVDRDNNFYNNYLNISNRVPSIEKSRLMTLLGILIIYVIVIGPICYIVLKKKDKREVGWIAIPSIAIIFSIIVFAFSLTSNQKDSRINFVSCTNLNSLSPSTQVAFGVRTPKKGEITMELSDKINVYDDGGNRDYYDSYNSNSEPECQYSVVNNENSTSVVFHDQKAWTDNIMFTNINFKGENAIDGQFTIEGSNVVGTVTNNFDFDLFDVVVGFSGQYTKIDRIEAGGNAKVTLPLSMEEYQKWLNDNFTMARQMLLGLNEDEYQISMIFRKDISAEEACKLEKRYDLFRNKVLQSDSISQLVNENFNVVVAAFSEKQLIEGDKKINGKVSHEDWQNMYIKDFNIDLSKTVNYDLPLGYILPKDIYLENEGINSSSFDIYNYQIYTMTSDYLEFRYDLSKFDNLKDIEIEWESYDEVKGETKIFNFSNMKWEELKDADLKNNVNAYISDSKELKLGANVYSDTHVNLPKIRLKGGN